MIKKKYIVFLIVIALILTMFGLSFNKIALMIIPKLLEINSATLTQEQNMSLDSIRKVDNHPLYIMDYYGDYTQFLDIKKKYYMFLGIPRPKCSTLAIKCQNNDSFFGRNNDNIDCPVLLLFTHPKNGYASVSTIDISFLGFDTGNKTPLDSKGVATRLLYTPYFASDGMNEWGLAIGDMSIPGSKALINPDKETMFQGEMVRYVLDHAKNTNEAIDIISQYNVGFPKIPGHFLLSDRSGNSVVIEWVDGRMQVTKKNNWLSATNFILYGSEEKMKKCEQELQTSGKISEDINGKSYWRYTIIMGHLKKMYNEKINSGDIMNLLEKVSLAKDNDIYFPTQWSIVYNMKNGEISITLGRNYSTVHNFKLNNY